MNSHDEKWVGQQIAKLPHIEYKKKAWQGYKDTYKKAFDSELMEHKKENAAGKAANTALRSFINRVAL
jgi:hypothetical protein